MTSAVAGAVPAQRVTVEQVPVFGPEPIGEMQATGILESQLLDASGQANVASQYPMPKGAAVHTSFADLGPEQSFTPARIAGGNRASMGLTTPSLPSTKGGNVQDQLGSLGI